MRNTSVIRFVSLILAMLFAATGLAQDWPGWRGPNQDNKVIAFKAPATWPKELTKKWQITVGVGESSPIMAGEKIYTFGRKGSDEVILCIDAATGKDVWTYKHEAAPVKGAASPFPGTRSTPAVGEGKVCSLGVNGTVSCVDAVKGTKVWTKETQKPVFYTSTSPIVVDGKCIVFGNGLTAYDLKNGDVQWTWGKAGQAPYGSPVLMTIDGVKTIVTPSVGALVGVSLADGKELWKVSIGPGGMDYFHHYSTPLVDGANVYYSITAGKGAGGSMIGLKIEKQGDGFKATELWKNKTPADKYHSPVLNGDLIFGVNQGRMFYCMSAKTGETLWTDKTKRGSCGCILNAGADMIGLTSDMEMIVFKTNDKAFEQVAKYSVSTSETWSVPILTGNRIFVKDKGGTLTLLSVN